MAPHKESLPTIRTTSLSKKGKRAKPIFPVPPVTIQTVEVPRGTINHSYRDFANVPPEKGDETPIHDIRNMTFSQKVHHILSTPEYEGCISWMPHGRSFRIHVPKNFEVTVCPKYFNHRRYSSFLRDMNKYGFKHISKGADRNCYYHEFMLKGRPHLCKFMPRCRDARRLNADPDHEPNFYKLPVPEVVAKTEPVPFTSNYLAKDTCSQQMGADAAGMAVLSQVAALLQQPAANQNTSSPPTKGVATAPFVTVAPPEPTPVAPAQQSDLVQLLSSLAALRYQPVKPVAKDVPAPLAITAPSQPSRSMDSVQQPDCAQLVASLVALQQQPAKPAVNDVNQELISSLVSLARQQLEAAALATAIALLCRQSQPQGNNHGM
uniref:HSF-type DNA-binding domain-containing protein n=1 Tax=Amphora coffeiformis TaxID=265554 RepID=A0A7S3KYR0_9STRA